jgi:hypothetical protein
MKYLFLVLLFMLHFTGISYAQQNGNKPASPPKNATLKIMDDKKSVKDTVDHSKKLPAPDRKSNNNN